jgi:PD-(D/E)XK endonuclease
VTTALKGNTTEAAVLSALVQRDIAVLLPFGEGHPYDLVIQVADASFLRVQCKTARVLNECLRFNSRSTDHGRGPGSYVGLADVFGVYCPHLGSVFLVPVADVPRFEVFLRLEPARNNQRRRVRFAADYAIDRWTVEDLRGLTTKRGAGSEVPLRSVG